MKRFIAILLLAVTPAIASAKTNNCSYSRQVELLAKVMYHEARGEEQDGMLAVAEVVLNRMASPNYPDSLCKVVLAPYQFSPKVKHTKPSGEEWDAVVAVAREILRGDADLLEHGATHFLNPDALNSLPRWTKRFSKVGKVGNHVFYSDGSIG